MKEQLLVREWIVIFVLTGLILSLILIARFSRIEEDKEFQLAKGIVFNPPAQIEIMVEGAVEKPGVYQFLPGVSYQDILNEAKPAQNADRRRLKKKKLFYESQTIVVPAKQAKKK